MPGVWGIVVAAGTGERFGRPKQFAKLGDRTVVEWSVAACRSVCEGVVLVLPADHMDDSCGADAVVVGGATRSESVRCGLGAVPERAEVVIVHDAARPLASSQLFQSVVDALMETSADGVICALPVSDTLKRIDGSVPHAGGSKESKPPVVSATVDRDHLVSVQTPQAFRAEVLRRAHAEGGDATDDSALVENLGATVRVVQGDVRNLKLTTPSDLAYAQSLLEQGT